MAPTIAATAAKRAPPATPPSVANSICPPLVLLLLPLVPAEQLGHEVAVLVLVPAATGADAFH